MTGSKVALVTGAGSGIGRASARALYQAGYSLVLAGRREDALTSTVQEDWSDERYLVVPTDVTNANQVRTLFEQLVAKFGRLDVLFNNAGMGSPPTDVGDIDPAVFQKVMDTNVTGSFLCTQQAWKLMKAQGGGRIINNGSLSAHVPRPLSMPYTTAKHAISGLTKSINLDGRALGISGTQIDIGNAESPMTARMSEGVPQPNGQRLVEPIMKVEVVADSVVYIANLPLDVSLPSMSIVAREMPFVGRG